MRGGAEIMKKLLVLFVLLIGAGTCAYADGEQQSITMDTPVKWNPKAVGDAVEALYQSVIPRRSKLSQQGLDLVEAATVMHKKEPDLWNDAVYQDFDVRRALPRSLVNFLKAYQREAANGEGVSLRKVVDICLDGEILAPFCEVLAKEFLQRHVSLSLQDKEALDDVYVGRTYNAEDRIYAKGDTCYYAIIHNAPGFFSMDVWQDERCFGDSGLGNLVCSSNFDDAGMATCSYTEYGSDNLGSTYVRDIVFTLNTHTVRKGKNPDTGNLAAVVLGSSGFMTRVELKVWKGPWRLSYLSKKAKKINKEKEKAAKKAERQEKRDVKKAEQ